MMLLIVTVCGVLCHLQHRTQEENSRTLSITLRLHGREPLKNKKLSHKSNTLYVIQCGILPLLLQGWSLAIKQTQLVFVPTEMDSQAMLRRCGMVCTNKQEHLIYLLMDTFLLILVQASNQKNQYHNGYLFTTLEKSIVQFNFASHV